MSELANKFTLFIESSRILKILVYFLQEHKWRSIIVLSHKPLGGKFSEIFRSFISRKPRQCWLSKDNEVGIIWSKCQEKSIKWTPSRSKNRCLLCKGVRCKEDFHEVQPLLFQWIWLAGTINYKLQHLHRSLQPRYRKVAGKNNGYEKKNAIIFHMNYLLFL